MIAAVTVTTSPTEVLAAPTGRPYQFVALSNNGAATVWLKVVAGGDPVSATNGIQLAAGASFVVDQDNQARMFKSGVTAIVANGTTTLGVQAF